ncbi:ubiquitin carboxyl-terminal hydrolase 12-like [Sycon ciliatum]|uniref:ubiquitin carboxyl-terminal hydrolase 12-like n=1 Tax=Sycon ciliatum TaxID=27933 RepID=UPI0020ADE105|eukprot:scpid52069/ scgid19429/ Ubiquitin carboxyl-terminal hydrolase 12; Deubiquitinating enzyme 12; Ubiquitin thioesterase 12; Ubiquitin-specific-processing protease 12
MGNGTSSNAEHPVDGTTSDRLFGLYNFGNTCYCNSIIQALYFCRPFRERVLAYKPPSRADTLLTCLAEVFTCIHTNRRKNSVVTPKKFIAKLRKENVQFESYTQQDAQELFNYLINTFADLLEGEKKARLEEDPSCGAGSEVNWVHEIFQGTLTNETKCMTCEMVKYKDESFLDLSVDILDNTSISACLRGFSLTETLSSEYKYYCDTCRSKQEAQKRMLIKKLPPVLVLHLKRFKYHEQLGRFTKLNYRVAFPCELRVFNTAHDAEQAERLYQLMAVVIHCGTGPNRGHYITVARTQGNTWYLFDDDVVDHIDARSLELFFGSVADTKRQESGYILFYEAVAE